MPLSAKMEDQNNSHGTGIDQETEHTFSADQKTPATESPSPDPVQKGYKFEPIDLKSSPVLDPGLPPELWTIVQSAPANFTPQYFLEVSRNLLENPNLTASHLSRAELSYSSFTDASFNPSAQHPHELAGIIKHLKPDHQPLLVPGGVPGYELEWTVVRKLIPRNPNLDDPLLQTCHLFTSTDPVSISGQHGKPQDVPTERYLVVYLPHATDPETIPFYHPKVRGVAILYTYQPTMSPPGTLSIYFDLFPEKPLDNRLTRTALKMLEIIHKHSRGRSAGYQKRVHHDIVIPQKPFQDRYVYLKGKYAKPLIDNWIEQTPAEKHVFEDLGIAAFLIELWIDMYGGEQPSTPKIAATNANNEEEAEIEEENQRREKAAQANFPGFADIGCGNGLLVWILMQEGWRGWGFDARRRKTWSTFDENTQANLKEMLLVPEILVAGSDSKEQEGEASNGPAHHNGVFPTGTFIVSNHADELTVWTPILAFLSQSPFIAIPCCSHNFGGTRFRAPFYVEVTTTDTTTNSKPKNPSAYASLCSYITHLTSTVHYKPEKEYLRIPSTRNVAIVGRETVQGKENDIGVLGNFEERLAFVRSVVDKEMGECGIEAVKGMWLDRGGVLLKGDGKGGH